MAVESCSRSQLLQRWHRRLAQREVQKTYAGLGAEVYKAHRLGQENDWAGLPDVKQQLKRVQEAESRVFQVDAAAEQIHNDFSARKAELQAYYAGKRQEAAAQAAEPSGQTASPDADVS